MADPTHPLQAFMNAKSAEWKRQRAETQMTLGELAEVLEGMPEDVEVYGFGRPHSYRGYYSDLSFEPTDETSTAGELLTRIRMGIMGRTFTGYKGGEFLMGENTPVWISPYGTTAGGRLMALREEDGEVVPVTEKEPPPDTTPTEGETVE